MAYTVDQENVVNSRGSNLLVSAAAGSGKTFVLTGHVIGRILDENPAEQIDVDRMLIITFTEAAALEMKQRIEKAINEQLEKNPGSVRLLRQRALIPDAHISTIDSFFAWVVKTYFDKSEIDPEYRIDTSGQLEIMKREVFDKLLEEVMGRGDKNFLEFLDAFIPDKKLADSLFELVCSHLETFGSVSDREIFIKTIKNFCRNDYTSLDDVPLVKKLFEHYRRYVRSLGEVLTGLIGDAGLQHWDEYISLIRDKLDEISSIDNFTDFIDAVIEFEISKIPPKQGNPVEELFIKFRDDLIKKFIKDIKAKYKKDPPSAMLTAINGNGPRLLAYFNFFLEYVDALYKAKLEANIMDFSDISHEAYRIIRENPEVARELSEKFKLVIVDEYQDTNNLQEDAISLFANHNNYYMIGDIKQSIYGFRQASPEIFAAKYNSFGSEGDNVRIELSDNFRSRENVLSAVNSVFERIMYKELCGIDYDESAALKYGAHELYDATASPAYDAELLVYSSEENPATQREAQAVIVANKIKELVGRATIVDKEARPYKADYRDIVILSRNLTNIKPVTNALSMAGIPYSINMKRGYFDSNEVQLLLSVLRVIDNPYQNQYMLAVLTSPLAGFSDTEIARLVADYKCSRTDRDDIALYDCVLAGGDKKCKEFVLRLEEYRSVSKYIGVYELLERIMTDTDYLHFLKAQPDSELHLANIDLLIQKAHDFEKSSYSGIFDFINYIDRFIKNKGDQKEGVTFSESDNAVRIMTIHSSKGLEFPIVFLINCGDDLFKKNSSQVSVALSSDGLCAPYIDLDRSIRVETLPQTAVSVMSRDSELSEEMRLLYVAMTRAREKLYLVARNKLTKGEPEFVAGKGYCDYFDGFYPECIIRDCKSYLDMLRLSFADVNPYISCRVYTDKDIKKELKVLKRSHRQVLEELHSGNFEGADNEEISELISGLKEGYKPRAMKAAYSVSELKLAAAEEAATGEPAAEVLVPHIEGLGGAELGSAYHLVMEKIDPERALDEAYIASEIERLTSRGLIEEAIAQKIKPEFIAGFYRQEIGERAADAYKAGRLIREHEFVLSLPASEAQAGADDMDVPIIVQGIVDMFFISDAGITVIDYKTDRILPGQEDILIKHYARQLELYGRALSAHFGLPVTEKYLYSFALGKFIAV